ncbi:MAG: ATP-binding cassette domain-containing protein [Afipia sp.]|nr:ATP-binding cassette domain-containing protein [Afipia sp.]OJW64583.1 MAG: hypothetical protein BGO65_15900 [Afipia sp. 64-13]
MSGDVVIRAEGLGKKYLIQHQERQRYSRLSEVAVGAAKSAFRSVLSGLSSAEAATSVEEFWALKDVSFEIKSGEVVGIIGRNGAGKSTLLKLLSRITEPTSGRIEIKGRVASLLEVGTGFHPELTGRDNIFLNGSILGMSRAEIRSKFDEIVAFAEVERFLDTPIKRYSSGMYMRLAFAVAAHLEPEILIVDEVLAVGDAAFQRKCLGKMGEVARQGRTVLFVSHNMNAIERLCGRAIVLQQGSVSHLGDDVSAAIAVYLRESARQDSSQSGQLSWRSSTGQGSSKVDHIRIDEMSLDQPARNTSEHAIELSNDSPIRVTLSGEIIESSPALNLGMALYTSEGELLFWSCTTDSAEESWPSSAPGPFTLRCEIPARLLNEGAYRIEYISSLHFQRWVQAPNSGGPAIDFQIRGGLSDSPLWSAVRPGVLAPVLQWIRDDQ